MAYVRRGLITTWKGLTLKFPVKGKPAFLYWSDAPCYFAKHARPGAILWVISAHPPDPPSLVARLEITRRVDEDIGCREFPARLWKHFTGHRTVVQGHPKRSEFFAQNDASKALMELRFAGRRRPWSLKDMAKGRGARSGRWRSAFGSRFQRPRLVATARNEASLSAQALEELAKSARSRAVFISWKHPDHKRVGRARIRSLAGELVRQGYSVWWDQLVLPGPEGQEELFRNPPLMRRLLRSALRQSRALIAVCSPRYGTKTAASPENWTRNEWNRRYVNPARRRKLRRFVYPIAGPCFCLTGSGSSRLKSGDPDAAAKSLRKLLRLKCIPRVPQARISCGSRASTQCAAACPHPTAVRRLTR